MSIPTYQLPENLFSIADFLLTDPTTGQSTLPFFSQWIDWAEGQSGQVPHPYQVTIGGTPHNIGSRELPLEAAQWATNVDQSIIPWLSLFGDAQDPRSDIQTMVNNVWTNMMQAPQWGGNPLNLDVGYAVNNISSGFQMAALQQKYRDLGYSQDQINQVVGGLFPAGPAGGVSGIYGVQQGSPYYDLAQYLKNEVGGDRFDQPGFGFSSDPTQELMRLTQAAGVSPTPGVPVPVSNSSNNQGVQPTFLNPMFPFMELVTGNSWGGFDANGNPIRTPISPEQWLAKYGATGLFGPSQLEDIRAFMEPLGLNSQETSAANILNGPAMEQRLNGALGILDNVMMPGLQNLAETGFRTPTPDLYSAEQEAAAREMGLTGNRGLLEDAATTYMRDEFMPLMAERYAGQLGTFGTDFNAELARQNRLFSADIADTVSKNMLAGQGMWGDMTSSQGLLDSQLQEAASARRANALPLLGQWSMGSAQFPISFASDLNTIGSTLRQNEELTRPGQRALQLYQTLLTGATPGNIGYAAQGQLPSAGTQLAAGLAPQSQSFGGALLSGLAPSLGQGLGSLFGSGLGNLFSGGGFDNNGSFGLLGDLGGLISSGVGSLFSGLGGLFGGNSALGGGSTGYGNSTGSSYYDPRRQYV